MVSTRANSAFPQGSLIMFKKPLLVVGLFVACPSLTRDLVCTPVAFQVSNIRVKFSRDRLSSVEASIGSLQVLLVVVFTLEMEKAAAFFSLFPHSRNVPHKRPYAI